MRISIAHELSDRGFGKTTILKSGTYIGGEDIPVGKYILETCDDGKKYWRIVHREFGICVLEQKLLSCIISISLVDHAVNE